MDDVTTASNGPNLYALATRYQWLRLSDVADALDAVGRQDLTLVDPAVRPLWLGIKFWGVAATERVAPANKRMRVLDKEEARQSHGLWFRQEALYASGGGLNEHVREGSVVVTSTGGSGECGRWGSANALGMVARGAVGIVTDGYCRDTYEVALQKTPIACRARGRTIIPGRIEFVGLQEPVALGGVLVRPGDIVGCDDDGVIVVPQEVAEDVLAIALPILLDDMKSRRRLYVRTGLPPDQTVAVEEAEEFYRDLL